MQSPIQALKRIAIPHGFTVRGNTLFRVHGDGVFQTLKFQRERDKSWILSVGLQSLYSELIPQWFTSRGCIPRYSVASIKGERFIGNSCDQESKRYLDSQLAALDDGGLNWLDGIRTQCQLADALVFLDNSEGSVIWNDDMKIAPYLACRNLEAAEKVVWSILEQHRLADIYKRVHIKTALSARYTQFRNAEDTKLAYLLLIIQQQDWSAIHDYLSANYEQNIRLASFCMK